MNRKLFTTLVALVLSLPLFAQKVDLDAEAVTVNYTRLPRKPLQSDYQSYSAILSANPQDLQAVGLPEKFFTDNLKVFGYKKVKEGGNFNLELNLSDYRQAGGETKTKTTKSKDSAGKEIETKTYYYEAKYEHTLTLKIRNQDGKQLQEKTWLFGERTYNSREFGTIGEVNNYVKKNLGYDLSKNDQDALTASTREIYEFLNTQFGYTPVSGTLKLQILDSEKHPDYAGFQQALKTTKTAMAIMKADKPLDSVRLLLQPAMDFFSNQKEKYNPAEKGEKKLKYACLYNLALLNFWLEDLDKATEFANAVVVNDYDPKDGKRLLEDIENLRKDYTSTGKTTRHLKFEASETPSDVKAAEVTYKSDSDERKDDHKIKSLALTPNTVQYEGTVFGTDGIETKVLFLVENPRMTGLLFSSTGNVRYAIDLGTEYNVVRINKSKLTAFTFDGRMFKVSAFKSANSVNIGGGKTILEVLNDSPKVAAYLAFAGDNDGVTNPPEFVIQKIAEQQFISLNGLKFALDLNKGIRKNFDDCPAAVEAATKDEFKRKSEDIVRLAKMLEECTK